jgi:dienelactone hydrolase
VPGHVIRRWIAIGALLLAAAWASPSPAEQPPDLAHVELPPSGTGPLLVLFTGVDGAATHLEQAKAFGREGWVVHVVDSNLVMQEPARQIRERVKQSLARPEVRSAKAAAVGYSLGGWLVIAHANRMPDEFAAAVAYYPSTFRASEPRAFLASPVVRVPTLILAGVRDTYMNCCLIERARELLIAARRPEIQAPLELVEYPQADHGFVLPAYRPVYRPDDAADAMRRSTDHLRKYAPN